MLSTLPAWPDLSLITFLFVVFTGLRFQEQEHLMVYSGFSGTSLILLPVSLNITHLMMIFTLESRSSELLLRDFEH